MSEKEKPRCHNCMYFFSDCTDRYACHRNAPKGNGEKFNYAIWVSVQNYDWCGEHKFKDNTEGVSNLNDNDSYLVIIIN